MVEVLDSPGGKEKFLQEGIPGLHPYLPQVFLLNG